MRVYRGAKEGERDGGGEDNGIIKELTSSTTVHVLDDVYGAL